jgi:hypothetical protein
MSDKGEASLSATIGNWQWENYFIYTEISAAYKHRSTLSETI